MTVLASEFSFSRDVFRDNENMWMLVFALCSTHTLLRQCSGVTFIDSYPKAELTRTDDKELQIQASEPTHAYPPVRPTGTHNKNRRRMSSVKQRRHVRSYEDEKDNNLKAKIATLVQQTLHDTERKIKSIKHVKEKYRDTAPYRAGFILSMVKKSRDVLNELFNVAVKHRDDWKALEQLKIFELIVHTNVDTTNLVRQLVEIHIQHLNSTNSGVDTRRVVLLK